MQLILVSVNVFVLLSISAIHFYWAFGGTWGIRASIPDQVKDKFFDPKNKIFNAIYTAIVALGLILFAIIIASNYFDWTSLISKAWTILATRIIGGIFLIRAVGDFNMVGIFKKASSSLFAKSDTKIFIPICLFIGIVSFLISRWDLFY